MQIRRFPETKKSKYKPRHAFHQARPYVFYPVTRGVKSRYSASNRSSCRLLLRVIELGLAREELEVIGSCTRMHSVPSCSSCSHPALLHLAVHQWLHISRGEGAIKDLLKHPSKHVLLSSPLAEGNSRALTRYRHSYYGISEVRMKTASGSHGPLPCIFVL